MKGYFLLPSNNFCVCGVMYCVFYIGVWYFSLKYGWSYIRGYQNIKPSLISMGFKETLKNVNWFVFIWGQLMLTMLGIMFGMMLVGIGR